MKGMLGTLGEVGEGSGHVSLPDPRGGLESGQLPRARGRYLGVQTEWSALTSRPCW